MHTLNQGFDFLEGEGQGRAPRSPKAKVETGDYVVLLVILAVFGWLGKDGSFLPDSMPVRSLVFLLGCASFTLLAHRRKLRQH